eukprot:RCo031573
MLLTISQENSNNPVNPLPAIIPSSTFDTFSGCVGDRLICSALDLLSLCIPKCKPPPHSRSPAVEAPTLTVFPVSFLSASLGSPLAYTPPPARVLGSGNGLAAQSPSAPAPLGGRTAFGKERGASLPPASLPEESLRKLIAHYRTKAVHSAERRARGRVGQRPFSGNGAPSRLTLQHQPVPMPPAPLAPLPQAPATTTTEAGNPSTASSSSSSKGNTSGSQPWQRPPSR